MPSSRLVIVESPAKAKTIEKYLGPGFTVLASYGHVRDLIPKDGSVRPDEDFAMSWEIGDRSKKNITAIKQALKSADCLVLATDPDREGEAIAWHIYEVLGKALQKTDVQRVVFHEITKTAILSAMKKPRDLNMDLVSAYLARRALDYLVGFSISPVLWRKLPSARSAGRVQSVALRLVCEREAEIEAFKPQEYWSVNAIMKTDKRENFPTRLISFSGKKLTRFSLKNEAEAEAARTYVVKEQFTVTEVTPRKTQRHPTPPFTTSTLQQEASRKLGFGATRTMKVAQQLYEGGALKGSGDGLITYMRTDSVSLSQQALTRIRETIDKKFGKKYLPEKPRFYKTKARNAQEAHEAIRPTQLIRSPETLASRLDKDQIRLYELIWKRTMASQMASAELDQLSVDLTDQSKKTKLRATGSVIKFDGFLKVYRETRDDPETDDKEENGEDRHLPDLKVGMALEVVECKKNQHFTQPPPRYSEASLVQKLEELGIGRPSTYASILNVLKERNYVHLEQRRFIPEDSGWLVTGFLTRFFNRYVEYDFTAGLEEKLDNISHGETSWKAVLREFWNDFDKNVVTVKDINPSEIREHLDKDLEAHFFPEDAEGKARQCQLCKKGKLEIRTGRYGVFIGCSCYPDCRYTRQLASNAEEGDVPRDEIEFSEAIGRVLGRIEEKDVIVKKGPYGFYLQLGEAEKKSKKPKRATIPKQFDPSTITLSEAEKLLSLPRLVGKHPETGEEIIASIGPYGAYLKYQGYYSSLEEESDALDIQMNRAVQVLAEEKKGIQGETVGEHPSGGTISLNKGRYGPYLRHGTINASIPTALRGEKITLEEAIILIDKKKEKGPSSFQKTRKSFQKTRKKTGTKKKK